jgi:hypothetical protein
MLNKKLGLIAILATVAVGDILAGTITNYAVGDVLLCFRKSGGANDLVIDAGPISTFTNATLNQRIPITQYTGSQLGAALSATNGISWSAFGYFDDSVNPNWTVCMTRARSSFTLDTQSSPWSAGSAGAQQYLITTALSTIPPGANDNFTVTLYNANSTSAAVIEPDSSTGSTSGNYPDGQSYHTALDPLGGGDNNFGAFSGNPENTTTNNFTTTAGKVARSDFYYIPPTGSGAVKYLGYFELSNNATMTYVAYPTAIPLLKGISRSNNVATITYKTGIYGTYNLLGTNKLTSGALISTWPAVGSALSTGDNSTHTVQDTDSVNTNKFYILQGQ